MKERSLFIFMICFAATVFAGTDPIDSLKQVLATAGKDTNRVLLLLKLSFEERNRGAYDSAEKFTDSALTLSTSLNYPKGKGSALVNSGNTNDYRGKLPESLKNYFDALKVYEDALAKEVHLWALNGKISVLGNIGNILSKQGNPSEALKYHRQGLQLAEQMKDRKLIASAHNNIGIDYYRMSKLADALENFELSLALKKELGDKNGSVSCYNNIGAIYILLADSCPVHSEKRKTCLKKAKQNFLGALEIIKTSKNLNATVACYINLAKIAREEDLNAVEKYLGLALTLAKRSHYREGIEVCYQGLARLDSTRGHFNSALDHYKLYVSYHDSIINDQNTKRSVQTQMQFEFDKQASADSIKNEEQKKREEFKHEQEIQQQKLFSYGGAIGFALMLIVAVVSFKAYRQKRTANEIIREQTAIVEEKQKEILDSIHYAWRIQNSLLPTERYVERCLDRLNPKKRS